MNGLGSGATQPGRASWWGASDRLRRVTNTSSIPAVAGSFVTIEGPDGAGKTTQADRLRDHLAARGIAVLLTREPGGTWLGERLREVLLARTSTGAAPTDPLTDALLFNAARRQIVGEVIRPALAAGVTVICARFADSTLAYQGYGAGVPLDRLRALADVATDGLTPDLTILLDLPVDAGLARKAPGDVTRFEAEFDLDFHDRVRDGFLAIARSEPGRVAIVDATQDVDAVAEAIASVADDRLAVESDPGTARLRSQ
jgi:dTMP kinase